MDIYQAIILAIVQGITEFLPISSSAHLILLPQFMDLPDQGLAFDIVLHLGTLSAVVWYYKKDISGIIVNFFTQNPAVNNNAKIGWGIALATIPVGVAGLFCREYIESDLRNVKVIAYATIFFGLLLYSADFLYKKKEVLKTELTLLSMSVVGLFQALALIPGVSRSGITITAALLLGFHYKTATKFAFLLSIPVITLSSLLTLLDLVQTPEEVNWLIMFVGFGVSAMVAYLTIFLFIQLIEKIGMLPFVVYRLILGIVLLLL